MKRIGYMLCAVVAVTGGIVCMSFTPALAEGSATPVFDVRMPAGFRDWKLISVAHEEGDLNDLRAVLGNDIAIKAYREGALPFPDGAIIRGGGRHECPVYGQRLKEIRARLAGGVSPNLTMASPSARLHLAAVIPVMYPSKIATLSLLVMHPERDRGA